MADIDPEFACIIPETPAFLVWRVDGGKLRPVPEEEQGKFRRGDAYLVYSASEQTLHGRMKTVKGPLAQHIHFWVGPQASEQAKAVVKTKSEELDRLLGGRAMRHSESSWYQSARFRSYFNC